MGGRADRRALRRSGQHFTGTNQKWFTFTNGAHVDSLDPYTFNRLYDFLELYVAHQAPIVNSAVITSRGSGHLRRSDGAAQNRRRHASGRPDPGEARPTNRRWPPSKRSREIRVLFDNGAGTSPTGSTTRRRPLPGIRRVVPRLPDPRHEGQTWYFGPGGTLNEQQPAAEGRRLLHLQRERHAADGLTAPTPARAACGATPRSGNGTGSSRRQAPPCPTCRRRSRPTPPRSAEAPSTCGSSRRLRTSISRRPSARCVPTGTKRSSRTAGCGRASASSPPTRTNMFKQEPDRNSSRSRRCSHPMCNRCPRAQFVPVVDPAVLRGPRLPRGLARSGSTIAAPNGTQPIWSFSQTQPEGGTCDRVDRLLAEHAVEPDPPDRAGSQRADRAARVPEPAQRALPPLPGVRERRFLTSSSDHPGPHQTAPGGRCGSSTRRRALLTGLPHSDRCPWPAWRRPR